jgi:RNA polymerase sigma-70 factor (ECF subfamily)
MRENGLKPDEWRELLAQSRAGDGECLGQLMEDARQYLRFIAGRLVEEDVRGKLSGSDLVQDAFCEAVKSFAVFRGETREEMRSWLKRILIHNVLNQYRRLRGTQMRDVAREVPLDQPQETLRNLPDSATTPSGALMRGEAAQQLERALARLSDEHRQVIELRHREDLPFAEIGRRMHRSPDAARMLWSRAFEQLSRELDGKP